MSGGSSSGQQYQSTSGSTSSSSTTGPNPVLAPKLESMTNDLWSWYGANANAPGYYPGSTVAPQSDRTIAALTSLFQRGAAGSHGLDSATAELNRTIGGSYLDIGSNPYFQQALAAGFKPQTEQFMGEVLPGLDARFSGAGRYGPGLLADSTQRAVDSLTRAQADAAAKASSDAWGAERGRMVSALGLAPSYASYADDASYRDINAMLQAGAAGDAYAQRLTDADVARYNYGQTAQPDWWAKLAQTLQAIYPGGTTTGSGTSNSSGYATSNSNTTDSPLGSGLGLASLALQAYATSDARLKDDIAPVGKLADGQTVYRYRYRGDPRTQIGLLAQEVERLHPEAVATHPSGFKMVNYAAATAPAGGLF